jgi:hypothetical protein
MPPGWARRTPAEVAAEQAAADLALLRTLGFADPGVSPSATPPVAFAGPDGASPALVQVTPPSAPQPVRFRVVSRNQEPMAGAAVTLLDDAGQPAAGAAAADDGRGEVCAPAPGGYVLVSTAPGHQPGAVALTVESEPLDVEVPLIRSSSLSGVVHAYDEDLVEAQVTLLQDGDVVDSVETGADGRYRIGDLAPGLYVLSVAATGHGPVLRPVEVPEAQDVDHDVDVEPGSDLEDDMSPHDEMAIGRR